MKKVFIYLLILSSIHSLKSQSGGPYPKSIIDVGLGAGTNYGIIGAQAVLGYKGNGLLVAGGTFNGLPAYQMGLKLSYRWLFTSVCYGVYALAENGNTGQVDLMKGLILMGGIKLNLLKNKTLYFELGAGWAGGAAVVTPFGVIPINGPTGTIGIGYRIAFKK